MYDKTFLTLSFIAIFGIPIFADYIVTLSTIPLREMGEHMQSPQPNIVKISNCIWWEDYFLMLGRPDVAATHGLGDAWHTDLIPFNDTCFVTWNNGTVQMINMSVSEFRALTGFP
jgi:hypothetical protein